MTASLEILAVEGIGDIAPGADLAAEITTAAPWLRDGDVLVVTSKIVSKAEGQLVDVPLSGPEREAARARVLDAETARPVATRGSTRIVQTHHGFVMASAGIDASNVDRSRLVLLPKDPDGSARDLRAQLRERFGLDVAVIISDTMGRPWRNGLTDVALGAAGLPATRDHRGEIDPYGNQLQITQMAIVDELSAAAELVKGKCDQVPVGVIRGYLTPGTERADGPGAAVLVRDAASDLFSLGTAEARAAGLGAAAALGDADGFDAERHAAAPVERARVDRAVARVTFTAVAGVSIQAMDTPQAMTPPGTGYVIVLNHEQEPFALIEVGAEVQRLRAALAAEGLASIMMRLEMVRPDPPEFVLTRGPGLGLQTLAVGWPRAT